MHTFLQIYILKIDKNLSKEFMEKGNILQEGRFKRNGLYGQELLEKRTILQQESFKRNSLDGKELLGKRQYCSRKVLR